MNGVRATGGLVGMASGQIVLLGGTGSENQARALVAFVSYFLRIRRPPPLNPPSRSLSPAQYRDTYRYRSYHSLFHILYGLAGTLLSF